MRILAAIAIVTFLAWPALAQDGTHCDKLTDDDAFNKCLAAASPSRAGARPATAPISTSPETPAASAPRRSSRTSQSGYGPLRRAQESAARSRRHITQWRIERVQGGRVRMTIPVNGRRR